VSADLIASLEGFTRTDVDAFAVLSQARAAEAQEKGYFARSLVPVTDQNGTLLLDRDEAVRPGTTLWGLGGLKPSFALPGELGFDSVAIDRYPRVERIDHVHTPGNSSQIVDGAAAMLIGNERAGREHGLTPRARILAAAVIGAEPTIMLTGPAPATRKALHRAGLTLGDIDLFEINEAFAAQVIPSYRDLNIPLEKLNVNGGAIAVGHPFGMTGARITGTLINSLQFHDKQFGLETMCVGGGQGMAMVIERLS
jgi:acetyl-CoA C-acetyltransferase